MITRKNKTISGSHKPFAHTVNREPYAQLADGLDDGIFSPHLVQFHLYVFSSYPLGGKVGVQDYARWKLWAQVSALPCLGFL